MSAHNSFAFSYATANCFYHQHAFLLASLFEENKHYPITIGAHPRSQKVVLVGIYGIANADFYCLIESFTEIFSDSLIFI